MMASNSITLAFSFSHSSFFVADIGPEYPLLLPNILVTMEDTEQYGIFGDQANAEWVATTPRSLAYVRVGNGHRFMAISFGHQMHCIRELRVAVAYPSHPAASFEHTSHCLNYLRMYILCNPDLTMERFDPLERNFTSERFGATHVCKDWRLIYEMFERKSDEWADFRLKNMTQ